MNQAQHAYAPLTAGLIRRPSPSMGAAHMPGSARAGPIRWGEDLRFFAGAWAMGFVFFIAFLA